MMGDQERSTQSPLRRVLSLTTQDVEDPAVSALYAMISALQKNVKDLTAENTFLKNNRGEIIQQKVTLLDVTAHNAALEEEVRRLREQQKSSPLFMENTVLQDLRSILPQCNNTHESISELTSLHDELNGKCETIEAMHQNALKSLAKLTCVTSVADRATLMLEVKEKIQEIAKLHKDKENVIEKALKAGLEASRCTKSLFSTCKDLQAIYTDAEIHAVAKEVARAGEDMGILQDQHLTKWLERSADQAILAALTNQDRRGKLDVETVAALRMQIAQDHIDRARFIESWNPLQAVIRAKLNEVVPLLEDAIEVVEGVVVQKNQALSSKKENKSGGDAPLSEGLLQTLKDMRDEVELVQTMRIKAEKDTEGALQSEKFVRDELHWLRAHIGDPEVLQKEKEWLLQRKNEHEVDVGILQNALAAADENVATNNYGAFEYTISNVIDQVYSRRIVSFLKPHVEDLSESIGEGRQGFIETGSFADSSRLNTVTADILDSMRTNIQSMKVDISFMGREIESVSSAMAKLSLKNKAGGLSRTDSLIEPRGIVKQKSFKGNRIAKVPTEEKGVETDETDIFKEYIKARTSLQEEQKKVDILQQIIMRRQAASMHAPAVIPSVVESMSPDRLTHTESSPKRQVATHATSALSQEASPARVDALVKFYLSQGTVVPQNFGRVARSNQDRGGKSLSKPLSTFHFGTKKIQLIEVDRSLAVVVGGGFLRFDEFCAKFTDVETRRLNAKHKV